MAAEPLRLFPFTNWSLVLNVSGSHSHEYSGGESSLAVTSRGYNSDGHPTSSSQDSEMSTCHDWQDTQHALFQLANLCATVSLLTPSSFRHHVFFLRGLLAVAYILFIVWASLLICMMDVLIWNSVFFFVDFIHITSLAYSSIPSRVNPSLSEFYTKKLKPLKVCRRDFAEFCSLGDIVLLRKGSRYSAEGLTPCGQKVSLLLRGRLRVSHDGIFLHSVEQNEFVDSPEFDYSLLHLTDTCDKFQVTITAIDDSLLISWMYPTLRNYFASNRFLGAVFTNIVGKDISDKLYRIQELLLQSQHEAPLTMMSRNSSMVNVRTYLHSTDTQKADIPHGTGWVPKSTKNIHDLPESPSPVETRL